MCDQKIRLWLSILINPYFQLNTLKPGIYRFSGWHLDLINFNKALLFSLNALKPGLLWLLGSASPLALSVFMCNRNRICDSHVQLNTLTQYLRIYILNIYILFIFHIYDLCDRAILPYIYFFGTEPKSAIFQDGHTKSLWAQ